MTASSSESSSFSPHQLPDASGLVEEQVSSEVAYEGRAIYVRRDLARLPDGKVYPRDVIVHPGGVVVLPVLPDGRILFVQQFRYALGQALLELPAGKLDSHAHAPAHEREDPLKAAQRELAEETGYEAAHWQAHGYIYTAPGFCNERLWLFQATGLKIAEVVETHDPEENIQLVPLTLDECWQAVDQNILVDAKSIALISRAFR